MLSILSRVEGGNVEVLGLASIIVDFLVWAFGDAWFRLIG